MKSTSPILHNETIIILKSHDALQVSHSNTILFLPETLLHWKTNFSHCWVLLPVSVISDTLKVNSYAQNLFMQMCCFVVVVKKHAHTHTHNIYLLNHFKTYSSGVLSIFSLCNIYRTFFSPKLIFCTH